MDEDYLDYWEDELEYQPDPGRWITIYTLPPLAALVISVLLAVVMFRFAQGQLSGVQLADLLAASQLDTGQFETLPGAAPLLQRAEGDIAPLFSPSVQHWGAQILEWSHAWDIDPNLAATVMQIESCGHPQVVSSAGATGLFQVMPFHFHAGEDATDPDTNAARGLSYLSRSLAAHSGDVYHALAGYNAGIAGSQRGEANWPAETKRYTYWGSGIYADAQAGLANSARLDEWMAAGGAGLCRRTVDFLGINP